MRNPASLIVTVAVASLFASGCSLASAVIKRHGLERREGPDYVAVAKAEMERRVPGLNEWIDSMYSSGAMRDTFITRDGVRLHAVVSAAEGPSRKSAVIAHGFSANPIYMMHVGRMFRDSLGYNILMPSLRRHGQSGGECVQMGWNDRFDILEWSRIAHEVFDDTLQVFHGISMGAVSIMNASGEATPDYVRGFVADCGFSNLWDEVYKLAEEDFNLPAQSLLNNMDKIIVREYGWSIRDVVVTDQIAKCTKPMLFIHGDADQIVPTGMVWENYFAKTQGYSSVWIGEGSKHAFCIVDHPAEYLAVVRKFLAEQVEGTGL